MRTESCCPFRISILAVLSGFILALCGCAQTPTELTISDLKGVDAERYVGDIIVVEGTFVRDPIPILITDLQLVLVNRPMPEDQYIVLVGPAADEMDAAEIGGALLTVTGVLNATPDDDDDEAYKLELREFDVVSRQRPYNPQIMKFVIDPSTVEPDRYAILFSGGIKPAGNHGRYWNDLVFMYSTLVNKHGFDKNKIAVLYADGTALNKNLKVDYAGTEKNLATALNLLKREATEKDLVFFFTTNHGGGFDQAAWPHDGWGGALDTNGDEGTEQISEKAYNTDFNADGDTDDQIAWDETLFGWGQGDDVLDDAFGILFKDLKYARLIVVMEQCYSAGLIPDATTSTSNRLMMAAASQYEPSHAMPPNHDFNEFSYLVTAALNGADHSGGKVDADQNKDGRVSITEAFNYAEANDTRPETPHYEDNGDGVPHTGQMPDGGDGTLGATTFLGSANP